MRRMMIGLVAVVGALAMAPTAFADPPPFTPPGALSVTGATAGMTVMCRTTPALENALAANPTAGQAVVQALCKSKGQNAPATVVGSVRRVKPRATSLCVGAGCANIWLYNQGGGWGLAEYTAVPFSNYGFIIDGRANFARFTQSNGSTSGWGENVDRNFGTGWYGYRYIYPIANTSNSWVSVTMQGWAALSSGYIAGIGPVLTWNYITH